MSKGMCTWVWLCVGAYGLGIISLFGGDINCLLDASKDLLVCLNVLFEFMFRFPCQMPTCWCILLICKGPAARLAVSFPAIYWVAAEIRHKVHSLLPNRCSRLNFVTQTCSTYPVRGQQPTTFEYGIYYQFKLPNHWGQSSSGSCFVCCELRSERVMSLGRHYLIYLVASFSPAAGWIFHLLYLFSRAQNIAQCLLGLSAACKTIGFTCVWSQSVYHEHEYMKTVVLPEQNCRRSVIVYP